MDEDAFNLSIRKFLKHFGVTAQREIENAVRKAIEDGKLRGDESVPVRATLLLDGVLRDFHIDGAITLAAQPATPQA
jgi:ribosomal protein L1